MRLASWCVWLLAMLPGAAVAQFTVHRTGLAVGAPVHANTADSLSISPSVSSLSFTLVPRGRSAAVSLPFTVSFSFSQQRSASIYAYFGSADAALTGGSPTVNIPSSAVFSTTLTSSTPVAFTGSSPFSGNIAVTLLSNYAANGNGSANAAVKLLIDCTNLPQLPAGTYTGVVYLQAQAF